MKKFFAGNILRFEVFPVLKAMSAKLDKIQGALMDQTQQFQKDMDDLKTAVDANTNAIANVGVLIQQDNQTIVDQAAQIAALKAANPSLDLSALESNIASLQASNEKLQAIVAPQASAADTPAV